MNQTMKNKMVRKLTKDEAYIALRAEMLASEIHRFDVLIAEFKGDRLCALESGNVKAADDAVAQISVLQDMREALLAINHFKPRRGMFYCPQLKRSVFIPGGE